MRAPASCRVVEFRIQSGVREGAPAASWWFAPSPSTSHRYATIRRTVTVRSPAGVQNCAAWLTFSPRSAAPSGELGLHTSISGSNDEVSTIRVSVNPGGLSS